MLAPSSAQVYFSIRGAARLTSRLRRVSLKFLTTSEPNQTDPPPYRESSLRRCCLTHLRSHLLHELPHRRDVTGVALFRPHFVALCRLFQVRKRLLVFKGLAECRNYRFQRFPHAEKLAAGLKEEVFVQQPVVQQCARLLPVADHHSYVGPCFASHRRNARRVLETVHDVILSEPIASLP